MAVRDADIQRQAQDDKQEERGRKHTAERHRDTALDFEVIAAKWEDSGEGHARRAANVVARNDFKRLSNEDYRLYVAEAKAATIALDAADALKRRARRERRAAARVVHETGPYEAGSPHSWIRDRLAFQEPQAQSSFVLDRSDLTDMSPDVVRRRLFEHGRDVREALLRRSKYGRKAERILTEATRSEHDYEHRVNARLMIDAAKEYRAFGTGGGASATAPGEGSALVPPAFLIDAIWAPFRSPYRSFADQLNKSVQLPEYGYNIYLPAFTAGFSVTTAADNTSVSEGTPAATFASSAVALKAGSLTVSQQYLDRAGPGIAGDQVLFTQARSQLDQEIDSYALNRALTGAQTVTNNGSFELAKASAVGGLIGDLKKAKALLHNASGIRLKGTHAFMIGDLADYVSAWADAQGRPVFSPAFDDNQLPLRAVGDPNAEGFTGYWLAGLALFENNSIPTVATSTQTQVIVCRPSTILQLEGPVVPYVYPQAAATTLDAILGLRCYVATISRFRGEGVVSIFGSAYKTSNFA
jgi:hypothetical protein